MLILLIFYFLISNALTIKKEFSILFSRLLLISLCLNTILCYNNTFVSVLHKGIGVFGGLFHVTLYTQSFNIFIFIISIIILVLTSFYPKRLDTNQFTGGVHIVITEPYLNISCKNNEIYNTEMELYRIIEYPLIALFIITGSVFLMSSSDLVSMFLSIELQSYGLYIISSIHRNSEQATSGGLTYFLLGGLSSCFILLGSSLLYINTGCTNLESIYLINSISSISSEVFENTSGLLQSNNIISDLNSLYI